MGQLVGFIIITLLIVGGLLSTGATAVLAALPFELGLIGGVALATLLIGNSPAIARDALHGFVLAIGGSRWAQTDMAAMMGVLHRVLTAQRKVGMPGIEQDLDDPSSSPLFDNAPRLLKDGDALALLCDGVRALDGAQGRSNAEADRVAAHLEQSIATVYHRRTQAVRALQTVADALPALGIVAAVLGIIKTMSAIDESNAVIGAMIATALLGTFLGVFLSYGLVGPLANRFGQVVDDEMLVLSVIAAVVADVASGMGPRRAIDGARHSLPTHLRPSDDEIDSRLDGPSLSLVRRHAA